MSDIKLKDVRIKTGVLKRTFKEKSMYEQELASLQTKIEQYKMEGKDDYFMKKQTEMLNESARMVPDAERRFIKAYNDLKATVESDELSTENELVIAAHNILEEAKSQIPPE